MKALRIKINLNPDKEDDRRILDYLRYAGVSNTQAVRTAVLFYLDREENGGTNRQFLQEIKEAIRESVQSIQLEPGNHSVSVKEQESIEEDPVSGLEFLKELGCGPGFGDYGP